MTLSPTDQPADTVGVDLSGRTALVTGAGSGIGRATALRLSRAGADVLALDLNAEAVQEVAAATGGRAVIADLSDLAALDDLDLKATSWSTAPASSRSHPCTSSTPETLAHPADHARGAVPLIRQTLPGMYAAGWGRVINVSSVHGLRASEFKSAYVSAKHGLEGLSKVVALEGAPHGVTSNCVNPGYVRTPLVDQQVADQARAHGITEAEVLDTVLLAKAALKRLVEPEEVAEMVALLCSPTAASMTGTSLSWTAAGAPADPTSGRRATADLRDGGRHRPRRSLSGPAGPVSRGADHRSAGPTRVEHLPAEAAGFEPARGLSSTRLAGGRHKPG